MLHAFIAEDA